MGGLGGMSMGNMGVGGVGGMVGMGGNQSFNSHQLTTGGGSSGMGGNLNTNLNSGLNMGMGGMQGMGMNTGLQGSLDAMVCFHSRFFCSVVKGFLCYFPLVFCLSPGPGGMCEANTSHLKMCTFCICTYWYLQLCTYTDTYTYTRIYT